MLESASAKIASAIALPNIVPTTPPNIDRTTDSVSICAMMSDRRAERLAEAISRVRSVTTISMMFMMTMPRRRATTDNANQHREDALVAEL